MPARLAAALLLAVCAFPAHAAGDDAKFELFTGYSYLRRMPADDSVNLSGWQAALRWNVTRRIGLVAEGAGNYGGQPAVVFYQTFQPGPAPGFVSIGGGGIQQYTASLRKAAFLAGPELRVWRFRRLAANVRCLAGVARGQFDYPTFFGSDSPATPGLPSHTGFATSIGGSLDVRLTRRVSCRPIQAELLLADWGGDQWRNLRLSAGLILLLTK